MKKLILMGAFASFLFVGCTQNTEETENEEVEITTDDTLIVEPVMDDTLSTQMQDAANEIDKSAEELDNALNDL